jgi:hypothetical protein
MLQHVESSVKIYQSKDYKKFVAINGNRKLNDKKIKKIIADIDAGIDVLKYYPIQVFERGNTLEVDDGQHRLKISRLLLRPVYYIIMEEERSLPDIAKINSNVEKWKTSDFINCYIEQGNKNYEVLRKFMAEYKFSVTVSTKLLSTGNPGTESGFRDAHAFQRGQFKVEHYDKAVEIAETCRLFSEYKVWRERGFIIAIYRIKEAGRVSISDLLEKVNKHSDMLQKQSGFKDYIFNLENIFNRGRQIRVTLY